MRKSWFAGLVIGGFVGATATIAVGPFLNPDTSPVFSESSRGKSSFKPSTFDYAGILYMKGYVQPVSGSLTAPSARTALAMAFKLETYLARKVEAHMPAPGERPAVVDGLVWYYSLRIAPVPRRRT